MGCGGSKIEELEAVALCRNRSRLLAQAINARYELANAHARYSCSLRSVGESLRRFLNGIAVQNDPLALPHHRKGENLDASPSHSRSGSHIHFLSASDADSDFESDDDRDHDFHLHSDDDGDGDGSSASPMVGPTVSYAKNQSPNPSVTTVHVSSGGGEAYYGYSYDPPQNPSFYPYPYGYSGATGSTKVAEAELELRPPPSPPRVSNWDFLNLFESYEGYYGDAYSSSQSSKDVREEEGIPELEDEENEVSGGEDSSPDLRKGERNGEAEEREEEGGGNASTENVAVSAVEENMVVSDEVKRNEELENVDSLVPLKRYHNASEVMEEIKSQFDKASGSVVEVSKMLEMGKQPYHQTSSVYKGGRNLSLEFV